MHNGPSFPPLYESKRSRDLPHAPEWTTGLGWADVFIDFRLPHSRLPLPEDILHDTALNKVTDVERFTWGSRARGWSLHGWAWKPTAGTLGIPEDTGDHLIDSSSLIRFTAPDGFRFALAVSQDRPGEKPKFGQGRFSMLLPTMRWLFLFGDGTRDGDDKPAWYGKPPTNPSGIALLTEGFSHPTLTYDLNALREAVADPDGWFGDCTEGFVDGADWRSSSIAGPFRPIDPSRALLSGAAGGASSYAEVARWVCAGMDAAEVASWLTIEQSAAAEPPRPWTEAEALDWFPAMGGGRKRRKIARAFRDGGFTPEQGSRWHAVDGVTTGKDALQAVRDFEAAGWDPADVIAMRALIRAPWNSLAPVAEWTFVPREKVAAYFRAGISPSEAQALEASGEAVTSEMLAMMAGLVRGGEPEPEPDPWGW